MTPEHVWGPAGSYSLYGYLGALDDWLLGMYVKCSDGPRTPDTIKMSSTAATMHVRAMERHHGPTANPWQLFEAQIEVDHALPDGEVEFYRDGFLRGRIVGFTA